MRIPTPEMCGTCGTRCSGLLICPGCGSLTVTPPPAAKTARATRSAKGKARTGGRIPAVKERGRRKRES